MFDGSLEIRVTEPSTKAQREACQQASWEILPAL